MRSKQLSNEAERLGFAILLEIVVFSNLCYSLGGIPENSGCRTAVFLLSCPISEVAAAEIAAVKAVVARDVVAEAAAANAVK